MTVYVQMRHMRALGFCVHGLRRFFATNNLDFKKMVRGEMSVEELEATRQHQADQVVAYARAEAERENGRR